MWNTRNNMLIEREEKKHEGPGEWVRDPHVTCYRRRVKARTWRPQSMHKIANCHWAMALKQHIQHMHNEHIEKLAWMHTMSSRRSLCIISIGIIDARIRRELRCYSSLWCIQCAHLTNVINGSNQAHHLMVWMIARNAKNHKIYYSKDGIF